MQGCTSWLIVRVAYAGVWLAAACGSVPDLPVDAPPSYNLEVVREGANPQGTVTSSPPGIECGATCTMRVTAGTTVTLTTTTAGAVFAGWSGGSCSGAGSCAVTVTGDTSVTASYRALRVAVEAGPTSCLRDAANVIPRFLTLLTERGHMATVVAAADIGTMQAITAYDVVVIGGTGTCGGDIPGLETVIDGYVRGGGGLVGSGWNLFSSETGANVAAVLPSEKASNYLSGAQTVTLTPGSPITDGLAGFMTAQYLPWGSGPKEGATVLLTVGTTAVGESWTLDQGRSVFLASTENRAAGRGPAS